MAQVIDSHQHFWNRARGDYGWLAEDLGVLFADYGPEDLLPHLAECGVARTVLVQAAPTVNETRYLLDLAQQSEFIAGVVGWVDMEDLEAGSSALETLCLERKFVGIRPMLQDLDDTQWICRPTLRPVVDLLLEKQLCFDALIKAEHLSALLTFLKREKSLKCVIDHGAKPDIASGEWQPWADNMQALAEETTAFCKLSGLLTQARNDQGYDELAPYIEHLIKTFGPSRLIWGSDWPVLNLAADYKRWWEITERALAELAADDRDKVLGLNAEKFYGLNELKGCINESI